MTVAKNLASKVNTKQRFLKYLEKRQENSKSSNKKRNITLHKIIIIRW